MSKNTPLMARPIPTIHLSLLVIFLAFFLWSAIAPHDYFTWLLEMVPVLMGLIIVFATYQRFHLSTFVYVGMLAQAIFIMIGAKYTFGRVPVFEWLRDIGVFSRNNYDKVGHFAQGFFTVFYVRELLLRTSPLKQGKWLNFVIISICGAVAAVYEILEWWIGAVTGSVGDSFLGTQGYIWDTQSDMFLCFIGAILAVFFFSNMHDRAMKKITP